MSDPFDLVASGDLEGLRTVLAHEPGLARIRHSSGASLVAWAGFTPLQHGDAASAALLLFGADAKKQNAKGMDAAAHARTGGHEWLAVRPELR